MDPILVTAIIAGAKMLLDAYFKFTRLNGMTEKQIADLFEETKEEFDKRNPANLPEV